MKITKYVHSCILIEVKGKRILVDPGYLQYDESFLDDWKDIDVLLVTHKHKDHCHVPAIKDILANRKTKFFSSKEVAEAFPGIKPKIVKQGDIINEGDVKIKVVKAVHGWLPTMRGAKAVTENIGFIVNDGSVRAYVTSDTICFDHDYKCDVVLLPVSNHGVTMGPLEGALFAKDVGAKLAIPIHCESPKHPVDINEVRREFEKEGVRYKILNFKESIEI